MLVYYYKRARCRLSRLYYFILLRTIIVKELTGYDSLGETKYSLDIYKYIEYKNAKPVKISVVEL